MSRLDLDAIKGEADEEPHGPYVLGGEEFFVPRMDDWPAEGHDLFVVHGRAMDALRQILGDKDYKRFVKHKPNVRQVNAIFDDVAVGEGLGDAGNSEGSSGSSRSTPARSKRTSPASTKSTSRTSTAAA